MSCMLTFSKQYLLDPVCLLTSLWFRLKFVIHYTVFQVSGDIKALKGKFCDLKRRIRLLDIFKEKSLSRSLTQAAHEMSIPESTLRTWRTKEPIMRKSIADLEPFAHYFEDPPASDVTGSAASRLGVLHTWTGGEQPDAAAEPDSDASSAASEASAPATVCVPQGYGEGWTRIIDIGGRLGARPAYSFSKSRNVVHRCCSSLYEVCMLWDGGLP